MQSSTGRQKFEKVKAGLQFQKINIDMLQFSNSAVVNINSLKSVVVNATLLITPIFENVDGWFLRCERSCPDPELHLGGVQLLICTDGQSLVYGGGKNYNTVYPEALYNFFLIYFILNLWVYIIEILLSCAIWYFKSILI